MYPKHKWKLLIIDCQENGYDVWIDSEQMSAGNNIFDSMEEGIRTSDIIVVIFSEGTLKNAMIYSIFNRSKDDCLYVVIWE